MQTHAICKQGDSAVHAPQARGLEVNEESRESVEEMGWVYLKVKLEVQPEGSCCLGGWSFGGLVAFEMARQVI